MKESMLGTTIAEPVPAVPREAGDSFIKRRFTKEGGDVYEAAGPWTRRTARIVNHATGEVFFEQEDVLAPAAWSDLSVNVVASKYFRGHVGDDDREDSVRGLVERVVETIADWAREDGYLGDRERDAFRDELAFLVLHQGLAFNTPAWLNVGVDDRPQCSACYISAVGDSLDSIMDFAKAEARIFQRGGGSGANLSRLRASRELLSNGGTASGPISFMRGFDTFASAIKSGGRMRRAAKMICLDVDHPDLLEFVSCKVREEEKARVIRAAGFGGGIDGEAYASVFFQNENHSVRVSDAFMHAVSRDELWPLTTRTTGRVTDEHPAREIFREIARAAHAVGDPGIQFDDAINAWHTSPSAGRINASNPCAEFVFLDNSACNLASLNLRKFQKEDGSLDLAAFNAAVDVSILAQEVIVDRAGYPTEAIDSNSRAYRPLGLGYANLGAFLMNAGVAYDSDVGRGIAAEVTSAMTARAYHRSARLAALKGSFPGYEENRASFTEVLNRHREEAHRLAPSTIGQWDDAIARGTVHGYRNAQVTLLAPTGTIAFMMDCDTLGIEPDIALVKRKALVGGGTFELVNGTLISALYRMGYADGVPERISSHVREHGTVVGSEINPAAIPVFDCALEDVAGRSISVQGHLGMMAVVQPFLSGAISKTVNLPRDATVEDVEALYAEAWKLGLKSVTIYRDGSKDAQPLEAKRRNGNGAEVSEDPGGLLDKLRVGGVVSTRVKLPNEARTVRHKFDLGGVEGYIHVGLYDDGRVGEVFCRMAKEGSTISGLVDALATSVSIGLQYGVPLSVFVGKFSHWRFEPSGFSPDRRIGHASSIIDYIFRWLDLRFPDGRDASADEIASRALRRPQTSEYERLTPSSDAPFCQNCQTQMRRNGTCHVCPGCGVTTGCS